MAGAIWWQPDDPDAPIVKLDLTGCDFTRQTEPQLDAVQAVAESIAGKVRITTWRRRLRVAYQIEGIPTRALYRQLRTFLEYAQRGGAFGLAVDASRAWCGTLARPLGYAGVTVDADDHPLQATYSLTGGSAPTLSAGDLLYVHRRSPDRTAEVLTVSTYLRNAQDNGAVAVVSPAAYHEYLEGALVRTEDYYPLVRIEPGQLGAALLSSELRLSWDLTLPLVEDVAYETMSDTTTGPPPPGEVIFPAWSGGWS